MQAIIMAGGEGTRLRPITCSIPKPMAKLCGKPVVMYILELLKKNGFDSATLTLMYKADKIIDEFDNDIYKGLKLFYEIENSPLGTAGSVKNATKADDVLVISGDAMCDFDIKKAIEFHKERKSDATIIVKKVDDPREFGLVTFDTDGKINGFIEKPSYESCITDLANTGVYILSKAALDLIPKNQKSDFAGDIFPLMLRNNMNLFAYEESGYWCDIGDIGSYMKCQEDMLNGKVKCDIDGIKKPDGMIVFDEAYSQSKIEAPSFIGCNVKIGAGSIIKKGSILCDNVTIGENAKISSSIILDGALIGDRANIASSVVCEKARLMRDCVVDEKAVIGEDSVIGEGSCIRNGVKIWQGRTVLKFQDISTDIRHSEKAMIFIDDEGIRGEINVDITPSLVSKLGSTLASLNNNDVVIGCKNTTVSKALSLSLASGIMSSGSNAVDFGECTEQQLAFCMDKVNSKIGCYIDGGSVTKLKILSEGGLPITRKEERKIEAGINRGEYSKATASTFGKYSDVSHIKGLYEISLNSIMPQKLNGICTEIRTSDMYIAGLCDRIIFTKNDFKGTRIVIHLSGDGSKVSFYSDETGNVSYDKLIALASKIMLEKGKDISIPYHYPNTIEKISKAFGRKTYRYYNCSCDETDKEAREKARECCFTRDGLLLSVIILSYLSDKNISLSQAINDIPEFYSSTRYVSIKKSPSVIMKNICKEKVGLSEGVVIDNSLGRVLIRPVKTGKGIMMFVESFKSENAMELCDKFERIIKEKGND